MFGKAFIILIFSFFASAQIPPDSKPRHDLYKKIKKTTNVSLKEAYQAVFNNKGLVKYRLSQYADIKGVKGIINGIDAEIKAQKNRCEKSKNKLACEKQVEDLEKQKGFISNLDKEVSKNPRLSLYRSLVVFSYTVRHEILKPSYEKWDKDCSSQKKINTMRCKKQFFETDILYAIVRDLAQASYSKALKQPLSVNKSELKKLVARYE